MIELNRRDFLRTSAALAATAVLPKWAPADADKPNRPNIIVIMVDDMGFSDIGCYGGEIATPNIDRLANRGMRFTQCYNNAKCEPSRASLFTANYPGWYARGETILWGPAMKAAGYRTYRVGKVHETGGHFDRAWTMGACGSYWDLRRDAKDEPKAPLLDGKPIEDSAKKYPDFYTTDFFTDRAIEFLEQDKCRPEPFFLYVAYNAPHYPLHARPDDIARYRGKYMIGWDKLREQRYKRQLELGVIDKSVPLSPRDDGIPAWESLSKEDQEKQDHLMATYAAMIDRADQNVGRLLAKVKELGQEQNTLVMFLSDNGGCSKSGAGFPAGSEPGPKGTWHFVGRNWANASNTPFRKYKTWDHEGGISTPLIAYWPGHIKPNTFDRQVGNIMDIPVTCLDVAGKKPARVGGLSLAPVFDGKERELHETLCWAILKGKAARKGKWKAVRYGEEPWRLYDIEADRTESTDLAGKEPAKLKELIAIWDDWNSKCKYIGE
jgi:arylsulfatase